jgi:acetyl-CoA carboxylase biotin carboxyl carrier protein
MLARLPFHARVGSFPDIGHNLPVTGAGDQIEALAELMDEFRLLEAQLELDGVSVTFRRSLSIRHDSGEAGEGTPIYFGSPEVSAEPAAPVGTPITSPMNGIYFSAPSPSSAPFVKEGDSVTAGETVALIEAMKVYNEITSPVSGTVLKVNCTSGQMVNPGDVLMTVG